MIISRENDGLITVQMTPRYVGVLFAGILCVVTLVIFSIASASGAEYRPGGVSRTPNGGPVLLLLVGAPLMIYLDWRRNRRSLTFDSTSRTVTIVGKGAATYSIDEIERFFLGATTAVTRPASQINIQFKDGRVIESGVNSSFGSSEIPELAVQKLGERLKAAEIKETI